ncbi:hypothetical protein THAOC_00947 [Thalassiosira oceanica]|uniref:Uncharacterized protein n=1 Tax=Thalassiosira oceanica TaxID=159749 RepID=K0TJE5_THAOC|nr:hypothetical protein THAOC_00947 [Thalassiosira oceanica]|eukprot:EJK77234.1 hypothetical protein THAOC_00947 [Thalassiosira oceanica]
MPSVQHVAVQTCPNFPRKQTWVAPKALPELMNDKYQVHGATESEGDIRTFFIDEGTKANKPAWDLMLIEKETADVAVSDAMHGAHAQNKSVSAPTQSWEAIGSKALLIDEGTKANKPAWDLMLMEKETAVVAVPDTAVSDTAVSGYGSVGCGRLTQNKSVGAPTQSWEAIGSKALLIDEGTKANKPAWDLMLIEEETADVAVSDAMHGAHAQNKSVSAPTQSREAIGSKALLIDEGTKANKPAWDLMLMEKETAVVAVLDTAVSDTAVSDAAESDVMHGALTQNKSVGAPTQSWEAILEALLIDEGTQAQHNRPPFDVIYMEEDDKEDGMRTTIILVTQLPKSTQVDCLREDSLDLDQHLVSFKWLLIVMGGFSSDVAGLDLDQIYLEEQKLEKQQQSLQQLRQEMESGFTDLANKLSALQEIESGFARKLSALTSIGSSNSRNSESSSPRSNARKLQSFASESPVDYQRDCTRHTVDQAVIYRKIIDHFYDQDDIYYNRGAHVLLQFGRKYLTLYPLYRVPAVNGERNKNSFYDPRRPGNYLHLSRTMTIGTEQLGSGDPIDRDRIECYGDLRCVQREADELVLGCQGSADHHVDYCIMERINLACSSDLAHVTSGRVSMSQHMERKCPYIEKFDGTANSAMNLFLPEKTGFLRTFLDWAVGGVTDIADASERRYAPDRQMSLEVNFDVDISSQNNGGSSKGRLGSYALNINSGWDSFEPWDYFCSPVHDKEGGYGDSNHWSVFRLIDPPGNFCLSVDSYGVSEDLQQAVCGDLSSVPSGQKFVAFLSESDNSQFVLRPHGAVVENKDVCFHPGGDHTKSRDCHDNEYFFTTSVASPGEMELNFISSGSTSSTFKMR